MKCICRSYLQLKLHYWPLNTLIETAEKTIFTAPVKVQLGPAPPTSTAFQMLSKAIYHKHKQESMTKQQYGSAVYTLNLLIILECSFHGRLWLYMLFILFDKFEPSRFLTDLGCVSFVQICITSQLIIIVNIHKLLTWDLPIECLI